MQHSAGELIGRPVGTAIIDDEQVVDAELTSVVAHPSWQHVCLVARHRHNGNPRWMIHGGRHRGAHVGARERRGLARHRHRLGNMRWGRSPDSKTLAAAPTAWIRDGNQGRLLDVILQGVGDVTEPRQAGLLLVHRARLPPSHRVILSARLSEVALCEDVSGDQADSRNPAAPLAKASTSGAATMTRPLRLGCARHGGLSSSTVWGGRRVVSPSFMCEILGHPA